MTFKCFIWIQHGVSSLTFAGNQPEKSGNLIVDVCDRGFFEWGRVQSKTCLLKGYRECYRECDEKEVIYVVKSRKVIPHLEHMIRHAFLVYLPM